VRVFSDDILAIGTIRGEARGEPREGKMGVGEVIRTRMRLHYNSDGTMPGTVCAPFQFSCWNHNDPNRLMILKSDDQDAEWMDCKHAWVQSEHTDYTNGAVLYHARWLKPLPYWVKNCRVVARIGQHIFYVERNT
jgi:N-acetylmuramoyl-L-alanine amidase